MNTCPECAAEINATDVIVGEIVQCGDCSVELEVLSVVPVSFGVAPSEEEDWGE
jgi:alpha-aminoadipate carrier protein LysW